jgi:acetyltransferase
MSITTGKIGANKPNSGKPTSVIEQGEHPLDVFFTPKNIAVIGATETAGSVGRTTLWNLISSPFGGTVFPINPKRKSILGIRAYKSILDVPEPVDLAVVVTPAPSVPAVIHECGQVGVTGAIVISAGFKELGPGGLALEQQVLQEARQGGLRIIGPNCLGLMCPPTGVNATFARGMANPGSVGFISQSGALCTAVLDWSFESRVGFSAFISIGSMVDVDWGDLIQYLGRDVRTRSILIYMESIGDARSFLSAAREVALSKPIIVIKAGRTAAGGKAAASHTGALTGSDAVLDAAFRRVGVLRVDRISDLFYMAEVLAKQPRPKGPRLTIVTNAGGPAVLATDALIETGGEIAELEPETIAALNEVLPAQWSRGNPIDILGDGGPDRYAKALEIAAKDPNSDGMIVVLTPQAMTDPTQTAEKLKPYANSLNKPVLAAWMGGPEVAAGTDILSRAGIPTFPYPDTAARAFLYMWRYTYNLNGLYETPHMPLDEAGEKDRRAVTDLIDDVRASGRTLLTEFESKNLLALYGIPTVETRIAATTDEAVSHAEEIGYPVVLKLYSETITHKTDVGGVKLNLANPDAVRRAFESIRETVTAKAGAEHFQGVTVQPMVKLDGYEIILGSSIDPQFGPVLLFGLGGQLVEVFKDRALALPPLNTTLARRMMEQTKIYRALKGVRGRKSVDLGELEQLLVRFSQLVVQQPWIKEIDINPMLVGPERIVALDARVVLHDVADEKKLPHAAIRPYPVQYTWQWSLTDGTPVTIRPIRPEDEPLLVKFHETLSDRSVYLRYLHMLKLSQRVAHERLTRICFIDYARETALVVEKTDEGGDRQVLAVGRLQRLADEHQAEFALLVSDEYQGKGIGPELLARLIEVARREGLKLLTADILADNNAMQRICAKAGFRLHREIGDPTVSAELEL